MRLKRSPLGPDLATTNYWRLLQARPQGCLHRGLRPGAFTIGPAGLSDTPHQIHGYHTSQPPAWPKNFAACRMAMDRVLVNRGAISARFPRAIHGRFWRRSDVRVRDTMRRTHKAQQQCERQQAIRFSTYFTSCRPGARGKTRGVPRRASPDARMRGHYFWDTARSTACRSKYYLPSDAKNICCLPDYQDDARCATRTRQAMGHRGARCSRVRTISGEEASARTTRPERHSIT